MASIPTAAPHVMMLPLPLNGHINPMMQLAQYLASVHVHVTFVYYCRPASTLSRKKILGHIAQFSVSRHIRVVVVPKGLSEEETSDRVNVVILAESLSAMETEMASLIEKAKGSERPVTCIVCDTHYGTWPQDLADKFGIPRADFSPSCATNYILFWHLPLLISRGYVHHRIGNVQPPCSTTKNMDVETIITCLPGVPPMLRVKDLPSFFLEGEQADGYLEHCLQAYHSGKDAKWVLIHTCYELERSVIDALRAEKIPAYSIGPLLPTSPVDNINAGKPSATDDNETGPTNISLPLEDVDECLRWLDTQRVSSVLYIAFGSSGSWSPSEIQALADGVEDSQQPFLWVIRPDMVVKGSTTSFSEVLPEGFAARTKHRSLMVPWAPQLAVLAHPSVGGFLTHSGWNSILEGIYYGVPMAAVADIADQPTNLRLITHEWKVGVGIERSREGGGVQREDVERAVRAVMGNGGDTVRRRVGEARGVVRRAISDGSSKRNLQTFVQDLWELCKQAKTTSYVSPSTPNPI